MSTAVGSVDDTPAQARHPLRELLARYASVFKLVWQHRHELAGPKRMSDEVAFLPAALSLQEAPPHPAGDVVRPSRSACYGPHATSGGKGSPRHREWTTGACFTGRG